MHARGAFDSIYSHGFVRVAVCTPRVEIASPDVNLGRALDLARRAVAGHAALVLFPELSLSAYSNEDLVQQDALLDAIEAAAGDLISASEALPAVLVAGARSDPQDFFLYYVSRFGFRPSKVAFLANHAWGCKDRGVWRPSIAPRERHEYDLPTIKRWLEVFLRRVIEESQFKRSAMPNGPKVGSGGSLSPRSDWRAPSDAPADVWIAERRDNVP